MTPAPCFLASATIFSFTVSVAIEIYTLSLHDALPIWDYDRTQGSTDTRDFNPRVWRSRIPDLGTDFFNFSPRSEEHTSELQSQFQLVCRLLPEKKYFLASATISAGSMSVGFAPATGSR